MTEDPEMILSLTADIVAAHVSNNSVAVGDVANLVHAVHAALISLGDGTAAEPESAKREPAVSVRSSVKSDLIACLVCGAKNKMLKRHLSSAHGLTPAEYRTEFGLKKDYPMVAPDYAATRSELAKRIGLGSSANRRKRTEKAAAKPRGRPRKQKEDQAT
jgi:predicted transcriptional regulator